MLRATILLGNPSISGPALQDNLGIRPPFCDLSASGQIGRARMCKCGMLAPYSM